MTLCDSVKSFGPKITENYRETRFCDFAPPDETVGVIDVSAAGNGSRGIAFLTDGMIVKLDGDARRISYRDIRVMETLPSYETPFEDELMISSPAGDIRISDCSLNKFFLRQLISNMSRIIMRMSDSDREALEQQMTSDALDYYAEQLFAQSDSSEKAQEAQTTRKPPAERVEAAAAVPEIAAAKKAALSGAEPKTLDILDIPEESIEWLSSPHVPMEPEKPMETAKSAEKPREPVLAAVMTAEEPDIEDMSREETMSYLLDSIAEINAPDVPDTPDTPDILAGEQRGSHVEPAQPAEPVNPMNTANPAEPTAEPVQTVQNIPTAESVAAAAPALTHEPDSQDIYIHASRSIRKLIEGGRLTMEQVNTAVREQLVEASEVYSGLDIGRAQLPAAVKKHARQLDAAADHLTDYFALGEDIAARVMFFMLYQMLSYTDRIVQTDATKQRLNYFFVRYGAAGMVLSMLDADFD